MNTNNFWIWEWSTGGYGLSRAQTEEKARAIAKGKASRRPQHPDVINLHIGTQGELDALYTLERIQLGHQKAYTAADLAAMLPVGPSLWKPEK